jgi:hypothetical protein
MQNLLGLTGCFGDRHPQRTILLAQKQIITHLTFTGATCSPYASNVYINNSTLLNMNYKQCSFSKHRFRFKHPCKEMLIWLLTFTLTSAKARDVNAKVDDGCTYRLLPRPQ